MGSKAGGCRGPWHRKSHEYRNTGGERVWTGGRCWLVGSLAREVGLHSMIRTLDFVPLVRSSHRGILSEKWVGDASYLFLRGPDTVCHPLHQKQT